MGLLDSILSAVTGNANSSSTQDQLIAAVGSLIEQNGGLQGLMSKFSEGGLSEIFSSWVGLGDNQGLDTNQLQSALGSEQITGLASQLGIDSGQASGFLAEYLPKIIDQLTPDGQVDPSANPQQGLAALMPSLLEGFGDSARQA